MLWSILHKNCNITQNSFFWKWYPYKEIGWNIVLQKLPREWHCLIHTNFVEAVALSHCCFTTVSLIQIFLCITGILCWFKDIFITTYKPSSILQQLSSIYLFALNTCCPSFQCITITKHATYSAYNLNQDLQYL